MKRKDPNEKNVPIAGTIEPETSEALEKRVKETGNRSFIINKSLRLYLGLDTEKTNSETKLAS